MASQTTPPRGGRHVLDAPACIILAGGLGTRLRTVLSDRPKPMAMVAGRPFLEWVLLSLAARGVLNTTISAGYQGSAIVNYVNGIPALPGCTTTVVCEPRPLGTGGAILHAARQSASTEKSWLICNGDSLILASLQPLLEAIHDPLVDGAVMGVRVSNNSRFGSIVVDADHCLSGFADGTGSSGLINAGLYLFKSHVVEGFGPKVPLSLEKEVLPELIGNGRRIRVVATTAPFIDIGIPESLKSADAFVSRHAGHFHYPSATGRIRVEAEPNA